MWASDNEQSINKLRPNQKGEKERRKKKISNLQLSGTRATKQL